MREKVWTLVVYLLLLITALVAFKLYKKHQRVTIAPDDYAMEPQYPPGRYWVKPLPPLRELKTGMVVAYQPPESEGREGRRLAHLVAVAGQRVSLSKEKLYVDGKVFAPSLRMALAGCFMPEIVVPDGCVFLLTNRPGGISDSYKCGPLSCVVLLGVVK